MTKTYTGDVLFQLHNEPFSCRFEVAMVNDDAFSIWIEDRVSKKQWKSNPLTRAMFVNEANAIPGTSMQLYTELFARCLQTADRKYSHELVASDTRRVLTLKLPLALGVREVTVTYKFTLHEVALERIDLLAARMRDVEEKLAAIESQPHRKQK